MTNALNVISPDKENGVWVFDDPKRGERPMARDEGGGNWYRSEQSCFVIARDLRSLAPSRASTCKTSWIDGSLF